ncbi:patatin-like phospholipase family protein [Accumulibacter sp.]|uniref:patatin-like phospholipase family protein n=1 Tax=Accumulibacter sp. TaxID=2053492 RepID=UPI001AD3C64F|nr:patatin-like phospholipase family protein [Accumulibacter sp.]MBN8515384.1 patatin-like phospholipase family protein [Accumulibacter sp.]
MPYDLQSSLKLLPTTLDAVQRPSLRPLAIATLDLPDDERARVDKLGLGSIDGLLSAGRVLAVPRWGGVAAMAQLGDMAAWSHPLEDLLPEPALAAPALLGQKEGEYADAAEAYAVNAALTLASCLLGAASGDWDDQRSDASFQLALGVDPLRQELRKGLLGRLAFPMPGLPKLGTPEMPLIPYQKLLGNTCLVGVYKAMHQLGAALSSAPREAGGAVIERLSPARGCPGTRVEIHGHGFGQPQPAGRSLVFPSSSGNVVVSVPASDWSDTLIRATAPAQVGVGAVGFVDGNAEAGELVGPAAQAFAGEVAHCLGPKAAAGMQDLMQALDSFHSAAITPTQGNWFRGGKPYVVAFTGNQSNPVLLRPSSELVLDWHVVNADTVSIRKAGPRQLPTVPGTLAEQGAHRFAPLRGSGAWSGRYILTASNSCGSVSAELAVEMRSRSAWALGGGGAKGAFEVGAMRCLVDAYGLRPDIVSGASVGALNAAKIAEGANGLAELEALWASLRTPADFFSLSGPLRSLLRNLGSEGLRLLDNVNLERMLAWHPTPSPTAQTLDMVASAFNGVASQLGNMGGAGVVFTVSNIVNEALRIGLTVGKIIQATQALVNSRSLLLLDPVLGKLQASVKPARIASSGIKLRVAVTSLDTGATEYVTETGAFASGRAYNDLISALQASASIPVAFAPVRLGDGAHYSDGGVTENIPIEAALQAGADEVIAILASPRPAVENFDRAVLKDIGARSFELLFDSGERRQLAPYAGWGVPVRVIEPLIEVCSTFQIEAGLVQINRDYGYLRAYEELQEDASLRRYLRDNSSQWVRSRLISWRQSFLANGACPPDVGLVEIQFAASPEALELVRIELQRQRELMAQRLQLCQNRRQCLPPGIERGWQAWGPCDYLPRNLNPWAEMVSSVVRQVAAATPPAAL